MRVQKLYANSGYEFALLDEEGREIFRRRGIPRLLARQRLFD